MPKRKWNAEESTKLYGVNRWGNGYFCINDEGDLCVSPQRHIPTLKVNLAEVVDEIRQSGVELPVVVRFHDILRSQVQLLNETFDQVIKEANYQGQYFGVYPIKVNQMREVIEEVIIAGRPYQYGLEAGSKPELLAALAYNETPGALTILNGYKDEDYMRLAFLGTELGRKVVIVVEKFSELKMIARLVEETGIRPVIGLRTKLMVEGKGKWKSSSGVRAKFGLSYVEIFNAINFLKAHNLLDCLELLHFHIGSQLPDIRGVKDAAAEAINVYVNLIKEGIDIRYIDVGGGLAVDYDGSQSTHDSSCNYSMEEYITDIVYTFMQNCDIHQVPHPHIVSESGRAITAHHSCVITNIIGEIKPDASDIDLGEEPDEHILVTNMRETSEGLNQDNYQEMYNDLIALKEQATNAFHLNVIKLKELAKIEALYWKLLQRINDYLAHEDFIPEQLQDLDAKLSSQYLANFSLFQSAIDSWAIDQMLPVMPITRLNEKPTVNASLVDITCDSDGKIDKFVCNAEVSPTLPMHKLEKGKPYDIGIFLTGAYQDVMGDMHNLFGRVNEVHIFSYDDDPKDFYIEEVIKGATMGTSLRTMQYIPELCAQKVKVAIEERVASGNIAPRAGVKLTDFYEECLDKYTYLKA